MVRVLLFIFCLIYSSALFAQCPGRATLEKKIVYAKNSGASNRDKLNELLQYDTTFNACGYEHDSTYTYLLMQIGEMYYFERDFYLAIHCTRQALEVINTHPNDPAINPHQKILLYYLLTIYCDSLKLIAQKNEAVDSCIASEKRFGTDYHYTCVLLAFKVAELNFKGDYNLYAEYSSLGEALVHKYYHESDSMDYINFFVSHRVIALSNLKRFSEAEEFLTQKKLLYLKTKNKTYLGAINYLLAQVYKSKEEYQTAINYLIKAFQFDSQTKKKDMSGEILNQIGAIYQEKLNEPAFALHYYTRALGYARQVDAITAYGKLATLYACKKNFDSSVYFFEQAFNKIGAGRNEESLLTHTENYISSASSENILNVVLDKADVFLKQYYCTNDNLYLVKALRTYKVADLLLNVIKSEQIVSESKLFWRNFARRLYEHAIQACFLKNDTQHAFYFFEKSRAALLVDQLNEKRLVRDDNLVILAQVKKKIVETDRALNAINHSPGEFAELNHKQFENKQELERIEQVIKTENPLYYRSMLDTGFTDLTTTQKKLLPDQRTLVELFNGDSATYSLFVSKTSADLFRIDKKDFDNTLQTYTSYLSSPAKMNTDYIGYLTNANRLYQLIFKKNYPLKKDIVVSPDGQYFPFESLVTDFSGKSVSYLVQDHSVSYTYSAKFLFSSFFPDASTGAENFMGIAPINYPKKFSLASLPNSDKSLAAISRLFSESANLISSLATRDNFMRRFYNYKIIQFYTHASDTSVNDEPVIYFSDSALYLSDLVTEHRPMTRLIVLSACETGLGKDYKGEGVFSFNRGFAALGVPSSVTNLWSVDNESTYKLTELFYKYVAKGLPLDEALQKAKLEFINTSSKEKQLPYYWAATILVGTTDSLTITKKTNWNYYYTAAITLPFLFIIYFILKKRKQFLPVRDIAEIPS